MTTETQPTPPTVQVVPEAGSRLEQLHSAYPAAKAAADEAAKQLKAITDGIKVELGGQLAEDGTKVDLIGPSGPALRMSWTETWRLDSRRLKAEDPEMYVRYAKKSGTWVLKSLGAGGEDQ